MNTHLSSWVSRRKGILAVAWLPILVGAWWAFRPEKLWINQKVSEPSPFASSNDPQALYTGRLEGESHQTSGRATIYRAPDGKQYLSLTDFSTSNGPDVHLVLAQGDEANLIQKIVKGQLDMVELGALRGNQGDQNYDLPGSVDLQKYNAAVIYSERFHAVFGLARLEQF
jgi:hypothetical protein